MQANSMRDPGGVVQKPYPHEITYRNEKEETCAKLIEINSGKCMV